MKTSLLLYCFLLSQPVTGSLLMQNVTAERKFCIGFSSNDPIDPNPPTLRVIITSTESEPTEFTVSTFNEGSFSGIVHPNSKEEFELSSNLIISSINERQSGIKILSNKSITVYGVNSKDHSTDGFLALPCTSYQVDSYTYYLVSTYWSNRTTSRYYSTGLIVGCEDGTEVTITPTQRITLPLDLISQTDPRSTIQPGESYTITINQMETFQFQSLLDLTSTRIDSNKPISVFSGHECADVPPGIRECNHIVEQIPPTITWGETFITVPLNNRTSNNLFKILNSGELTTQVNVHCIVPESGGHPQPFPLSLPGRGGVNELLLTSRMICSFQASRPILVMQLATGSSLNNNYGGPFMMIVPSVEQFGNNYTLPALSGFQNHVSIVVPAEHFDSSAILLNGSAVESPWEPINCSAITICGYGTRLHLDGVGTHQIYHADPQAKLTVLSYGYSSTQSYGFPTGLLLEDSDGCAVDAHNCDSNAHCINTVGSFLCQCNPGYTGNGLNCTDTDECALSMHNCDVNAECINTNGSFQCVCINGFSGNGESCSDTDECALSMHNCDVNAECINTNGSFQCVCINGFSGNGESCSGTHDCHASAECINFVGSFQCVCSEGFSGNGQNCLDIDECVQGIHNCHTSAECINSVGSFQCVCSEGFSGNGQDCSDIDECDLNSHNCDIKAGCINTIGTFHCVCNSGYTRNGETCSDIDECVQTTHNCHTSAECINSVGSFQCVCSEGFSGNGQNCSDIDECAQSTHDCHASAECINSVGSFQCVCSEGFSGNGQDCSDIDECALNSHNCDVNAGCINTIGSFHCVCNSGYSGDGETCSDIDECAQSTHDCHASAECINSVGSFQCVCSEGFSGNGQDCSDINECSLGLDNCSTNATCINSIGSFECECYVGYEGDGQNCSDINECTNIHNCDTNAECINNDGSFFCVCNTGYVGNGQNCTHATMNNGTDELDVCTPEMHNCSAYAHCISLVGSFQCVCNEGYEGDGQNCSDTDECTQNMHNCDANAECVNHDGGFMCTCNESFTGNGQSCTALCNPECVNGGQCITPNSCLCQPGWTGPDCAIGIEVDRPMVISVERLSAISLGVRWGPHTSEEQQGIVTSYTVFYAGKRNELQDCHTIDLEDAGVRRSFTAELNQTTVVIEDLVADHTYCVGVAANTPAGRTDISEARFVPLFTGTPFQLHLAGVGTCDQWVYDNGQTKLQDAERRIASAVNEACDCDFNESYIASTSWLLAQCLEVHPNQVVFQGKIVSKGNYSSVQLVNLMQTWVHGGASMTVQGVQLTVDPSCEAAVPELNDTDYCSHTGEPVPPDPDSPIVTVVAATVAAVLSLLLFLSCIVCFVCARRKNKQVKRKFNVYHRHPAQEMTVVHNPMIDDPEQPLQHPNDQPELEHQPQVPPHQPQGPSHQPQVPQRPQVPPRQPQVPPRQPQVPPRQPQVPPRQPQVPPRQPQVPSRQPQVPPRQPQVPPRQPQGPPYQPQVPNNRRNQLFRQYERIPAVVYENHQVEKITLPINSDASEVGQQNLGVGSRLSVISQRAIDGSGALLAQPPY